MAAWAGTVVTVPRDRLAHGLSNQETSADTRQLRLEEGSRALFSISSLDDIVVLVDHWPELKTAEARLLEQQMSLGCKQRCGAVRNALEDRRRSSSLVRYLPARKRCRVGCT
jgi:hypothetical protein